MEIEDTIELVESTTTYSESVTEFKTSSSVGKMFGKKNGSSKVPPFKSSNRIGSPPSDGRTVVLETSVSKIEDIVEMFEIKSRPDNAKSQSSILSDENDGRKPRKTGPHSETTGSILSLKSDGKSYREKVRERFRTIKEKTEKSLVKARSTPRSESVGDAETKNKRKVDIENRRNVLGKENQAVDAELHTYEKKNLSNVSQVDAYNFFCHEYRSEQYPGGAEDEIVVERVPEVVHEVQERTDSPVECYAAVLLDLREAEENALHWLHSGKVLTNEERLPEGAEPRYLEEEGFYVGKKPNISGKRLRILEQRLYGTGDKKWFDCDGELNILPDPRTSKSYREDAKLLCDKTLETFFIPGILQENEDILNAVVIADTKMLQFQISEVTFEHHPLFSAEHVIERKLLNFYHQYQLRTELHVQLRIRQRLEALRNAKKNVQNQLNARGDSVDANLEEKMECYGVEIRKLRSRNFEEAKKDREILKNILSTWKTMKRIRSKNEFSATKSKLLIAKEDVDKDEETRKWNEEKETTMQEFVDDLEEEHEEQMESYRENIRIWKQEKQTGSEIMSKPKKPRAVDEDSLKEKVDKLFKESFKPPGEPLLFFKVTDENEVSTDVGDVNEKLRRAAVLTTKVYFKMYCNNLQVCKSKQVPLNEQFSLKFDDNFGMYVTDFPEDVIVELYEVNVNTGKKALGCFELKVPYKESMDDDFKTGQCVKDCLIHYKHGGVGSGKTLGSILKPYELDDPDKELVLNTTATMSYKLKTNRKDTQQETSGQETIALKDQICNEDGLIDPKRLVKWVETNKPDPQDPKNAAIYEYVRNVKIDHTQINNHDYFRLNPQLEKLQFCKREELDENIRFKFLELRNRNEPEFVGLKISNREQELPTNLLKQYEKRIIREKNLETIAQENYDSIEGKRLYGRRFLRQAQRRIYKECKVSENTLSYDDVICEDVVPSLGTLALNFVDWLFPSRLLNMASQLSAQPKPSLTEVLPGKSTTKLMIKISGATNVPCRKDAVKTMASSRTWSHSSPALTNTSETNSKCFVEVTFQNSTVRTVSLGGSNPAWDEELCVPLDLEPAAFNNLHSFCDSLKINLFDENVTDLLEDERFRDQNVHQHVGRNWLGGVKVPFSAFCCSKIEGDFRLSSPVTLLSYQRDMEQTQTPNSSQKNVKDIYVTCQIHLQPKVPHLTYDLEELECKELPHVKEHIIGWNNYVSLNHPHRKFTALVIDIDGKTGCPTRYLGPLETPQLDALPLTPEQCARYVSMIPFSVHHGFYKNIWLTGEQLLNLMVGSITDHCILLLGFLQSLQIKCWLLLGYGIPHGAAPYVLTKESGEVDIQGSSLHVYDVFTGRKYKLHDKLSPLQKIYCIMNADNIWANIQWEDTLDLMRFDFTRTSDWLPMYNRRVVSPQQISSAQEPLIHKGCPDLQALEQNLEKKLRKKVMKWRKHEATVWNHYCCSILKKAVNKMELATMFTNLLAIEPPSELQAMANSHKMFGFALNLPFTSVAEILEFVRNTGFHYSSSPNAEYAIGICLNPYPNSVIAVWIFLVTIEVKL